MNQRIRELMIESGMYECDDFEPHPSFEKFAKLIIKECAMLVEGFEITQEVALDEYVDYEASNVLTQHFGVEQ